MTEDADGVDGDDRTADGESRPLEPAADDVLERAEADAPLAVIVEKPRAETAIESLRAEGSTTTRGACAKMSLSGLRSRSRSRRPKRR